MMRLFDLYECLNLDVARLKLSIFEPFPVNEEKAVEPTPQRYEDFLPYFDMEVIQINVNGNVVTAILEKE